MKKILLIKITIFALFSLLHAQSPKLNIAVNNLTGKGIDISAADILSDRIRSELINTGFFRVMERAEMEGILKEQGFQQTGSCDDHGCLVEVGQLLGVDRMVAGSIGKLGTLYTISLRMISVATGEILFTINEDCDCPINMVLSKSTKLAAEKLARSAGHEVAKIAILGKTGEIYITTDRSGAMVEIDGNTIAGKTPLTLKDFPAGDHTISVRKDNFYGFQKITLPPDDILKVDITMKKGSGFLKIYSKPPGAQVHIENSMKGNTPVKIKTSAGLHTVRLSKNGYISKEDSVMVEIDATREINIFLKPAAYISIHPDPKSVFPEVYINGILAGKGVVNNFLVPAGTVDIEVKHEDYDPFKETITLSEAGEKKITAPLTYKYGTVTVTSIPDTAVVFLNNKRKGITPYTYNKILPGQHILALELRKYETVWDTITIEKNKAANFSYTLDRSTQYKRGVRFTTRFLIGSLAAGFGATGIIFNSQYNKSYEKYSDYSSIDIKKHDAHWEECEKRKRIRNLMYSFTGAFSLCFGVSFLF